MLNIIWGILLKNIISYDHTAHSNLFTARRYNLVKSGYINATHARDPISLSMPGAEMFPANYAPFRVQGHNVQASAPDHGPLPIPASQQQKKC